MEDLQEMASLSTRFNYFENFDEKNEDSRKKSKDHEHEADQARRECKAKSVLNKWAELENKVLNGEDDGKLGKLSFFLFLEQLFTFHSMLLKIALNSLLKLVQLATKLTSKD